MKYIFGPVPSRRLGLSLGIDILPQKTCNMDCIYCEIGKGAGPINKRDFYIDEDEILKELESFIKKGKRPFDCITITASGEPTLHKGIKEIIQGIKGLSQRPVVILTNSSLLQKDDVREALCLCDIVLPSLDTVNPRTFRKINRPHPDLDIHEIKRGICELRKEMKGKMWLEVLFVKGINDSKEEIEALKNEIYEIRPHKVQLNTVVRPPAEGFARPVSQRRLNEIKDALGEIAEVIVDFEKKMNEGSTIILESEIIDTLKRRPLTSRDMEALFGRFKKGQKVVNDLLSKGIIKVKSLNGREFFITQ